MVTLYGINLCYYFYFLSSHFSKVILTTEEVITATLKMISATTKVILATEEVTTATLKVISVTTKVILTTEDVHLGRPWYGRKLSIQSQTICHDQRNMVGCAQMTS